MGLECCDFSIFACWSLFLWGQWLTPLTDPGRVVDFSVYILSKKPDEWNPEVSLIFEIYFPWD